MLEIIVETLRDALAAEAGGATQLDFKSAFPIDGLTPSAGMLETVLGAVGIDVLVLIRPHARSFVYSADEIEAMCRDIRLGRKLGASAFLLGCLTVDGQLDVDAIKQLQDATDGLMLHLNLAWELAADPAEALETAIELGMRSARITGGAQSALEGIVQIRQHAQRVDGRIDLLLARGVSADTIGQLVAETGVRHAHAGRGVRNPSTPFGVVDRDKVKALARALEHALGAVS